MQSQRMSPNPRPPDRAVSQYVRWWPSSPADFSCVRTTSRLRFRSLRSAPALLTIAVWSRVGGRDSRRHHQAAGFAAWWAAGARMAKESKNLHCPRGSRLNELLLIRLEPAEPDEDTRARRRRHRRLFGDMHACRMPGDTLDSGSAGDKDVLKCFCHNSEYAPP